MARISHDRSQFQPIEATQDPNDQLVGSKLTGDFDKAMEGAPEDEPNKISDLREYELELINSDRILDIDRQISNLDEKIREKKSQGRDTLVLDKQKALLKKIRSKTINSALLAKSQESSARKQNPKLAKLDEETLQRDWNELKKMVEAEEAEKIERKETTANIYSSEEMKSLIGELKHLDDKISSLLKNEQKKGNLIILLKNKRELISRKINDLNLLLRFNIRISKGETDSNDKTTQATIKRLTDSINTVNENLSLIDTEIEGLSEGNNYKEQTGTTGMIPRQKEELKVVSVENVKHNLVSFLKESEIDPSLYPLFTEDAVLLEDLLKGAKQKEDKLILDPKILSKFASAKLKEATDQLAVAGIKLDDYGDPKVGIFSKIFTNKAINQKNDPAYKKYKLWVDSYSKIEDSVPENYNEYVDADEVSGYRVTEKPEKIDKVLEEVKATSSPNANETDSRWENIADKAGAVGAIASTVAVLGAVGPGLTEKHIAEQHQDTKETPITAVAPATESEPITGGSPFLKNQSERLDRLAELEEEVGRGDITNVARRPEESEEKSGRDSLVNARRTKLEKPKKMSVGEPQNEEPQDEEGPQPISYGNEPSKLTKRERKGLPETSYESALNYVEDPDSASQPYSEAFDSYKEPTKKGPEPKIKRPEILPPPDNDIEKIIKLFPQELVDASGNKARFKDYVAHILSYAPDASLELTKLSTEFKAVKSMKSRDQIKNIFLSLREIAKKHGVPIWDKAKFIMDYITQK